MDDISSLVTAMHAAVPPGKTTLSEHEISLLRPFTRLLASAFPESENEYLRYLSVRERALPVPDEATGGWAAGATAVVTGGTGCIGSAVTARLLALGARRVVSLSRGLTRCWPRADGAEYVFADVRDRTALASLFAQVRPDVVFHVAAQRDPGLAEQAVHQTVTTNVFGTRNVIAAAEQAGTEKVVLASTGKTVIPYTPDVYPSTKRIAEWLAASAAGRCRAVYTAARFTHVVDNSIVHQRICAGCEDGLIRLHGPHSAFYVQSALESAQLLICAGAGTGTGSLGVYAISDLGWPADLLSVALGALASRKSDAAIYFSGYDPGYRGYTPFPGQYDPEVSWETSPLINAIEARTGHRAGYGYVDTFPKAPLPGSGHLAGLLAELEETCTQTQDPGPVRGRLDVLARAVFEATLDTLPLGSLLRILGAGDGNEQERLAHPQLMAAVESCVASRANSGGPR